MARSHPRLLERLPNNRHPEQAAADASPLGSALGTAEQRARVSERQRQFRSIRRRGRNGASVIAEPSLLNDADFRMLWLSRLLSQTAQGALLYAMLILVVDLSDRTIYSSLFVLCSIIPSMLFGLPAGVVVDAVPRRVLLVILNLLRFTFMLFIVSAAEPSLGDVFAATLGIWVIHQFYAPAEASLMGAIVPSARYTSAQALFNLALTIAQALGLVLLAPLLLRAGGPRTVFAAAGLLFMVAGLLTVLLPAVGRAEQRLQRRHRSIRDILGEGWRFAKGDRPTFEAILDDVLVAIGMSALVVIVPFYLERVLNTSKENTVFVFAPAALGLIFGLRLAPVLGRLFGERLVATGSLFIFAASVGALGFVEQLHDLLTGLLHLPLDQISDLLSISPLILVAMLISIPAGFASALVNVAARSILLSRTPERVRGQVIATQGLMGNVGALFPTLLAGIATDIFGVQPIAVAIALATMLVALAAHAWGRRPPVPVETASLA
ncbi:MAG TPA: MFS transporter [Thermomicrobiales bacterium]|nr:MFS transporter [Thermomicrobiales bacterium]